MKILGFILIGLAALFFLAMFACWGLVVWQGDPRWRETALMLLMPCLVAGAAGGMIVGFSE